AKEGVRRCSFRRARGGQNSYMGAPPVGKPRKDDPVGSVRAGDKSVGRGPGGSLRRHKKFSTVLLEVGDGLCGSAAPALGGGINIADCFGMVTTGDRR